MNKEKSTDNTDANSDGTVSSLKNTNISEAKIEAKSVSYAKGLGVLCFKIYNPSSSGWPDRLFVFPNGEHVWIEFKAPKKRLRKLQEYRCDQLETNEAIVYRGVKSYRRAKQIIDNHCGI